MVFVGVDTHKSSLAVCLVDELGRQLAVKAFRNDRQGHRRLHGWVERQAPGGRRLGIESSGWLGHGLALYLLERGEDVRDVRGHMTERERSRLRIWLYDRRHEFKADVRDVQRQPVHLHGSVLYELAQLNCELNSKADRIARCRREAEAGFFDGTEPPSEWSSSSECWRDLLSRSLRALAGQVTPSKLLRWSRLCTAPQRLGVEP
jgi:Transposase